MTSYYRFIGDVSNIVLSMPHRGRLNLLSVMLNYPHDALFSKVKGNSEFPKGCLASGDVLSHLGEVAIWYIFATTHRTQVHPWISTMVAKISFTFR